MRLRCPLFSCLASVGAPKEESAGWCPVIRGGSSGVRRRDLHACQQQPMAPITEVGGTSRNPEAESLGREWCKAKSAQSSWTAPLLITSAKAQACWQPWGRVESTIETLLKVTGGVPREQCCQSGNQTSRWKGREPVRVTDQPSGLQLTTEGWETTEDL